MLRRRLRPLMLLHLLGQAMGEFGGLGFEDEFVFDGEFAQVFEGLFIGGLQLFVLGLAEEEVELEGLAGVFDAEHAAEELVGFFFDAFGRQALSGFGGAEAA
ncbi:MAG: hypothetical protein B7Z37_31195 [Verrucomicrobia bacterium 12-59-8]|nr:MAG: hypothetical protein B7Z37_31195 [Verrucomicrobia bacterium 12-59-8]